MARTPKTFAFGQITQSTLFVIPYTVPSKAVTDASLVLTNADATTINELSVFINDGTTDRLLVKKPIPAGLGKTFRVLEMSDVKLSAGFSVKIQASSSTPVNFFLSGSEFTV